MRMAWIPVLLCSLAVAEDAKEVSRADLGRAYLAVERALRDHPPEGDEWIAINREFDRITLAFFRSDAGAALGGLAQLAARIRGGPPDPAAPGDDEVGGGRAASDPERLPSEVRSLNEARLANVPAETPEMVQAIASARARNRLLSDRPSTDRSAEFLADPVSLMASLDEEIASLEGGENPYRRRAGDLWRVIERHGALLPFRLYAPEAATGEEPVPLLIALHGAGGDENLFFEGYGLGRVKELADEHGFLVATPHTVKFSTRPEVFDLLVETLAREYSVDPDRIYLLGHSLGAMAAGTAARARRDRVAAACLIAGRPIGPERGLPPTLLILGGLDPLFPAKPESGGSALEVRTYPRFGHTLIVGHALPDAVSWLLRHRR